MSEIVIIGGGFGGLAAVRRLTRSLKDSRIVLIDQKATTDFLPTLPDCLGRGIDPDFLACTIGRLSGKWGFSFMQDKVVSLDLKGLQVKTTSDNLSYDYLIIASGSETNFYGREDIRKSSCKLDSVDDVKKIRAILSRGGYDNYLIAGGGYTGVEVATNLKSFLINNKRRGNVIIIERAPAILGPLPQWMKDYVSENLRILGVEVLVNSAIDKMESGKVSLAGGRNFDNALVIWAAGVRTADFIQALTREKNPQGRLKVDEYLRLDERCFVAGDAAYFQDKTGFLRMAVQFAIAQGECAAINIERSIKGARLKKYRPTDLGYIIPMANNYSCGRVLGINFRVRLATALHFFMCIYRSCGWKNRWGIVKGLTGSDPDS
jgi:NADH:ubiquinone reductase (H+-translocating)